MPNAVPMGNQSRLKNDTIMANILPQFFSRSRPKPASRLGNANANMNIPVVVPTTAKMDNASRSPETKPMPQRKAKSDNLLDNSSEKQNLG